MHSNLRTWAASLWWRSRLVGAVASRAAGILLGTALWTIAPRRAEPALALLGGDALARVGSRSRYRVRVHNTSAKIRHVTLHVRGWRDDDVRPAFDLRMDLAVGPRATTERCVESTWQGDASWVAAGPGDGLIAWDARLAGRWRVEARIGDRESLRIAGMFVA